VTLISPYLDCSALSHSVGVNSRSLSFAGQLHGEVCRDDWDCSEGDICDLSFHCGKIKRKRKSRNFMILQEFEW
jgi:hypothetical protein